MKYWIILVLLLFPTLGVAAPHGGGIALLPLALAGLFVANKNWRELKREEKLVLSGLLLVLVTTLLSLFNSEVLYESFKKVERVLAVALVIPVVLIFIRYRLNPGPYFSVGLLGACFISFLVAIIQVFYLGYPNALGAYYDIMFGDLTALLSLIALSWTILIANNARKKLIGGLAASLALAACVMADSRGAWLLLLASPVILFAINAHKFSKKQVGFSLVGAIAAMGILFSIPAVKQGLTLGLSDIERFIENPVMKDRASLTSWGERLNLWRDSIILWKEHPIVGNGLGDFEHRRQELIDQNISNLYMSYNHSHSAYFDSLANTGLLGLVGMLMGLFILPAVFFYRSYKNTDNAQVRFFAASGILVVAGFFLFGIGEAWLSRNPMTRAYALYFAVCFWGVIWHRFSKIEAGIK